MKQIPLANSALMALVDDEDWERLYKRTWRLTKNPHKNVQYVVSDERCGTGCRKYLMHREVLGLSGSRFPLVDHRDKDGLNNQKSNLRAATTSQNCANASGRSGTSKYKGVSWDVEKRKWRARICCNRRSIGLGRFDDERSAAEAYDKKAEELFGEFALLNFRG